VRTSRLAPGLIDWSEGFLRDLLFLSHRLPYPPNKGCRIRSYHLLRSLAARYRIHLLTFADEGQEPADWAPLAELCASIEVLPLRAPLAYLHTALAVASRRPLTLAYFNSLQLRRAVARWRRKPPAVTFAYSTAMAPVALAVGAPALLDMVDVDSAKWAQFARRGPLLMRPVHALEARRMRRYEAAVAPRFAHVTLATERETDLLRSMAPGAQVSTVRNGSEREAPPEPVLPDVDPTLVFTGQMDYLPNVDAVVHLAHAVVPRLLERHPQLKLLIVGRAPTPAVRRLANLPGIVVTGGVPDVEPYLRRAWIFVAPLRISQGVQTKVLEAMVAGLPVVTSSAVMAGLRDGGVVAGEDLLVADEDDAVIAAIERLLVEPAERFRLGRNARVRVSTAYDWCRAGEQLAGLMEEVCAAGEGAAAVDCPPANHGLGALADA
jgi:sugar transferase (PEP-CTERM/EpsH1 system associated)